MTLRGHMNMTQRNMAKYTEEHYAILFQIYLALFPNTQTRELN